jgi:hypothetical protein
MQPSCAIDIFQHFYSNRPSPARATPIRQRPIPKAAAPLSVEELPVALALASAPVSEELAKPVCIAVTEAESVLPVTLAEVWVAGAVPNVVLVPYTDAALQFCSRCCWTVKTPGSFGQLL